MSIAATTPTSYAADTTWNGSTYDSVESYVVPSGADVLVLRLGGNSTTPTSVEYGGVALTKRADELDGDAGSSYIYDLISPVAGTDDLIIDTAASPREYRGVISTVSDVDLATPRGAVVVDSGFKDTLSSTLVTTTTALCLDIINIRTSRTASVTGAASQAAEVEAAASSTNYQVYSSKASATTTSTIMSWLMTGTNRVSQAAISYNQDLNSLSLSGPDTTTVGAERIAAGVALDTPTTAGLKVESSYSLSLTIDAQTTTTLTQTDDIGTPTLGSPVDSLPVTADTAAAGSTAWQIQQWVDDGVNPEVTRNITLAGLAGTKTVQYMIDTSNTTVGESFVGTDIIAVEDNMTMTYQEVTDTVTLTVNADGTFTTDKDQTIALDLIFWSPSTGEASLANVTVRGSAILSGSGITRSLTRTLTRSLTRQV
jgi:hypothetical protein